MMEQVSKQENIEYSSLPPRKTIHKNKKKAKKYKINLLQLIVGAFILLIFITGYILYPDHEARKEQNGIPINPPNFEVIQPESNLSSNQNLNPNREKDQNEVVQEIETKEETKESIHIVKPGENLYRISLKYYQSGKYVSALAKYNGLKNSDDLYAGFKLKIPDKSLLQ
ncbi:LysM domain protein [Tepidibacillus sp. HK-1]|nr:LysM domain protein [Tepidibacillus sp. HK-1]